MAVHRGIGLGLLLLLVVQFSCASLHSAKPGDAPVNSVLMWEPSADAVGYDVYFGKGSRLDFQARVKAPKFILETLSAGTTYSWRADVVTATGVATPGKVQRFTTVANPSRDEKFAWSIRIANSVHKQYPRPVDLRGWNYTEGMTMDALYAIASRTGRDGDFAYIQQWADRFVNEQGGIDPAQYDFKLFSLDRVRPGPVLLWLYDRTKQEKYLKAATYLATQIDQQPRTSDGGMWHRSTYPNQMWLDGIYMADVYAAQFGVKTNQPKYVDEAIKQIMLMHKHALDPKTGLYYHGWEETKTRPWANKETGTSPEFWARAIGWYVMALADVLDWLPKDHPGRQQILPVFQNLCASLLKVQDRQTAMWYQILDKPKADKNYLETSCSIMYAYAFARGAQRGWLPPEYLEHARRAARGILNREVDLLDNDCMDIRGTVSVGTLGPGGGFYDYYVSVPVVTNDLKSVGAFMYLSMALSETAQDGITGLKGIPKTAP